MNRLSRCSGAKRSVPLVTMALSLAFGCGDPADDLLGGKKPTDEAAPVDGVTVACSSGIVPKARLWRLSTAQYVNSVRALFGQEIDPAAFPLDGIADDGMTRFDTNADVAIVTDQLSAVYRNQAGTVARAAVATLSSGPHACVLDASSPDDCLRSFAEDVAGRAYRRPLSSEESDRFVAFHKEQRTANDANVAARMVLEAILQSPHFLYRSELGEGSTGKVRLSPYELASELSYFITDGPPDDQLRAAASKNELGNAAAVRAHAERLVQTPAFRAKMRHFFTDYLFLRGLVEGGKPKDAEAFPTFNDAIRGALVDETLTFIDKAIFENNETLETLFSADYSYQSAAVANYYGTKAAGDGATRVPLPAGRKGLLSHAAVLAGLSNERTTSPIHRGIFYMQTLLCKQLPEVPADISAMTGKLSDPNNPNATERDKWNYFQTSAAGCASCHKKFQPFGLALEKFDAVGAFRTTEFGKLIDTSISVVGVGAGVDGQYADGLDLAEKIVASPEGHACFARQYTTYSFGRRLEADENCRVDSFASHFANDKLTIQKLIVEMTIEEGFFFRTHEEN